MSHRPRILLLLFTAVGAIALLGAVCSGASASEFEGSALPATVSGEFSGEGLAFAVEGGLGLELTCAVSVSGTLGEVSKTLTLTPTYSKCKSFAFWEASVATEGCAFAVQGGQEIEAEDYAATTSITCPAGKSIKVKAGSCAFEIGPQSGLSGAKAEDETQIFPEDFTLSEKVTNVVYTVTTDDSLCPFNGTGKKEGGVFSGSVLLKAKDEVLTEVGVALADAHVAPTPVLFTEANQTKAGSLYFTAAGTFLVVEQFLKTGIVGTEGFILTKNSKESCEEVTVAAGEIRSCPFTI